jgi:hypothetical protein
MRVVRAPVVGPSNVQPTQESSFAERLKAEAPPERKELIDELLAEPEDTSRDKL